jgi:hypothetical protein
MEIGSSDSVTNYGVQARCGKWDDRVCMEPLLWVDNNWYRVYGNHLYSRPAAFPNECNRNALAQVFCLAATGSSAIVSETESKRTDSESYLPYRLIQFYQHDNCAPGASTVTLTASDVTSYVSLQPTDNAFNSHIECSGF